jgi:glycosyltransferase involved in cell wall biosynthesis
MWVPETGSPHGGHRVQMDMTARHLAERGDVSVRLCRDDTPDWDGVDIVHGMGITGVQVRAARRRGIPVCLSVIYLSQAYRTGQLARRPLRETIATRARAATVVSISAAQGRWVEKATEYSCWTIDTVGLYESADMLLPNSELEGRQLLADLAVSTPIHVVPNAVDPSLFTNETPWQDRGGALYVGRLEPHKNQLRLISALRDTDIPLTIVGPDHPHHPGYANAVRKEAADATNVEIIGAVPHEALNAYYNKARVHVVPSLFETTGLVSLEGALCGCNIVSTNVGYAREYLEEMAWYCEPYDLQSIRDAVEAALSAPPQDALRTRIRERYTWRHTAEATVAAYEELLRARLGTRGG